MISIKLFLLRIYVGKVAGEKIYPLNSKSMKAYVKQRWSGKAGKRLQIKLLFFCKKKDSALRCGAHLKQYLQRLMAFY